MLNREVNRWTNIPPAGETKSEVDRLALKSHVMDAFVYTELENSAVSNPQTLHSSLIYRTTHSYLYLQTSLHFMLL